MGFGILTGDVGVAPAGAWRDIVAVIDNRGQAGRAHQRFVSFRVSLLGEISEWNREKQISGVVFDLETSARGVRIARARHELFISRLAKRRAVSLSGKCVHYVGIWIVFSSNGESINRHGGTLRDERANTMRSATQAKTPNRKLRRSCELQRNRFERVGSLRPEQGAGVAGSASLRPNPARRTLTPFRSAEQHEREAAND